MLVTKADRKLVEPYINEVMAEIHGRLAPSARLPNFDRVMQYPLLHQFGVAYEPAMERACKARRQGASSRAEALEWAFDALTANTGYRRAGEVWGPVEYTTASGQVVRGFLALVREREEWE